MEDRRKHQRVTLPNRARTYAVDENGTVMGLVRSLGIGGAMIETEETFPDGQPHPILIVNEEEGVRCRVLVQPRYANAYGVGFEFLEIDPEAVAKMEELIEKYREMTSMFA